MLRLIISLVIISYMKSSLIAQSVTGIISYVQIDTFGQPTNTKMFFDNNKSISIANRGEKSKKTILANGEELNQLDINKGMEQLQMGAPLNCRKRV